MNTRKGFSPAEFGERGERGERAAKEDDFFIDAFKEMDVPEKIKNAAIRICKSYNISGICDPVYIANVIAMELGLGDGKSNFYK